MMRHWGPIDVNIGGTYTLLHQGHSLIPQEPDELQAYQRRLFHTTMPPSCAWSQAAGGILRKGIQLEATRLGGLAQGRHRQRQMAALLTAGLSRRCFMAIAPALSTSPTTSTSTPCSASSQRSPYFVRLFAEDPGLATENRNGREWSAAELKRFRPDGRFGEQIIHQVPRDGSPSRWWPERDRQVWRDYAGDPNENTGAGNVTRGSSSKELPRRCDPVFCVYSHKLRLSPASRCLRSRIWRSVTARCRLSQLLRRLNAAAVPEGLGCASRRRTAGAESKPTSLGLCHLMAMRSSSTDFDGDRLRC